MIFPKLTEDLYVLNMNQTTDKDLIYKFRRSTVVRTKDYLFSFNKEFAGVSPIITIKKDQSIFQENAHLARMFMCKILHKFKRTNEIVDRQGKVEYLSWFRGKGCDFFGDDQILNQAFTMRSFMTPFSYF